MGQKSKKTLAEFFGFLALEGHMMRLGLEITFCIFLFNILSGTFKFLAPSGPNWEVAAWFASWIATGLIDYSFFGTASRVYKETFKLQQAGETEKAELLLNSLSPSSNSSIACPESLFYRRLAEIRIAGGKFEQAREAIEKLGENEQSSLGTSSAAELLKIKLIEAENGAEDCLSYLAESGGEKRDPLLLMEQGVLMLKTQANRWDTLQVFDQILAQPNYSHPCGYASHNLALSYREVCRLWTGHAEEAIEELGIHISLMQRVAAFEPYLKAHLAVLYVERAYYLATHGEPWRAVQDTAIAKAISSDQYILTRIEVCQEELMYRYDIDPNQTEEPGPLVLPVESEA